MKSTVIDLYCGLGGWAEAFLDEGWNVIGFDIERHDYGTGGRHDHERNINIAGSVPEGE